MSIEFSENSQIYIEFKICILVYLHSLIIAVDLIDLIDLSIEVTVLQTAYKNQSPHILFYKLTNCSADLFLIISIIYNSN